MSDSHYALNADPPTYTQKEVDTMNAEINALNLHIITLRQEVTKVMENTKAVYALSRAFNTNDSLATHSLNMHIVIEQLCVNSMLVVQEYHSSYPECDTSAYPE